MSIDIGGMRKPYLKVKYSEKATRFCEIFTLLLPLWTVVKSKVKILLNFVAFSEYVKFTGKTLQVLKHNQKNQEQFSLYPMLQDILV